MRKLECSELTKVYQDHRKALDRISFSVETLIRILSTELDLLLEPHE
jgi:hypothetical protein